MPRSTLGVGHSWWSVEFHEENDGINFGSNVSIDDLFAGDCTIECWFFIPAWPAAGGTFLISKYNAAVTNGWAFYVDAAGNLVFNAQFGVNDLLVASGNTPTMRWIHTALDWDVGTLTGRLFASGALVVQDVAAGAYQVDAAIDCIVNGYNNIGRSDKSMSIGPIRLSDTRRYAGAGPYAMPQPPHWPANDANAQLITRMNDGAGANVTDYSGNGNNGTIAFGATTRWYNDPDPVHV